MGELTVGLGLWHEDVQSIIDGFAYGRNPKLRDHDIRRPDQLYWPSALELQVGSLDIFTANGITRKPFDSDSFSHDAAQEFWISLVNKRLTSGQELHALNTEHAIHQTLDWVRSKPYRGVHSSDGVYDKVTHTVVPCDLTHPDMRLRNVAIRKYQSLMTLAKAIEATSFVIHPIPQDTVDGRWLGMTSMLGERESRKQHFYSSLKELLEYHKDQGATFPILIENLEFPKFPATAEELFDMWKQANDISQSLGLPPSTIQVCFDLQHMRHSYKIINEAQNRQSYEKFPDIESLLPGFPQSGRAYFGTSYHTQWEEAIKDDPRDIGQVVLAGMARTIGVIHLAGNNQSWRMDSVSETQGSISYISRSEKVKPTALHIRKAIHMIFKNNIQAPIIIEDQTPGDFRVHLASAEAVARYIKDEHSPGP